MHTFTIFALVSSVLAIVYGLALTKVILKKKSGSEKMKEIANAIQAGAKAYLSLAQEFIARNQRNGSLEYANQRHTIRNSMPDYKD